MTCSANVVNRKPSLLNMNKSQTKFETGHVASISATHLLHDTYTS